MFIRSAYWNDISTSVCSRDGPLAAHATSTHLSQVSCTNTKSHISVALDETYRGTPKKLSWICLRSSKQNNYSLEERPFSKA